MTANKLEGKARELLAECSNGRTPRSDGLIEVGQAVDAIVRALDTARQREIHDLEHQHTCSYYCDRPDCVKAQRDELREAYVARQSEGMVPDGLRVIGELIRTQDNRITDSPIFIVQQKRERVADADYDHDRIVWVGEDNTEISAEEAQAAEEHFKAEYEAPEGLRRLAVRVEWEFVTACFTEQGCKDYLARDGHNLKEPRIYAAGSYRNEEFRAVRKFLMSLAAAPADAGEVA